jgi:hypothetical protein
MTMPFPLSRGARLAGWAPSNGPFLVSPGVGSGGPTPTLPAFLPLAGASYLGAPASFGICMACGGGGVKNGAVCGSCGGSGNG